MGNNPMDEFVAMCQQNPGQLQERFRRFQQGVQGDPQKQVMEMLQSGRINQQQYAMAQQAARMMMQMFGIK